MFATVNTHGYVENVFTINVPGSIALPDTADYDNGRRYKRVDNAWVDAFPGLADGEPMMTAYSNLNTTWTIAAQKVPMTPMIKRAAAEKITALDWKVERATEVDAATGSSTLAAVYVERAAIRAASNAKETALAAITTYEDLNAFDPTDF